MAAMSPQTLMIAGGAGLALVLAGFFYLVTIADSAKPAQQEQRIELPNVFKN